MSAYAELHAATKAKAAQELERGQVIVRAYVHLVEEEDSPHVGKRPSLMFLAILDALVRLNGRSWIAEIKAEAEAEWGRGEVDASRILARMRRLGLVVRELEQGDARQLKRRLRTYYELTPAGLSLAEELA